MQTTKYIEIITFMMIFFIKQETVSNSKVLLFIFIFSSISVYTKLWRILLSNKSDFLFFEIFKSTESTSRNELGWKQNF